VGCSPAGAGVSDWYWLGDRAEEADTGMHHKSGADLAGRSLEPPRSIRGNVRSIQYSPAVRGLRWGGRMTQNTVDLELGLLWRREYEAFDVTLHSTSVSEEEQHIEVPHSAL